MTCPISFASVRLLGDFFTPMRTVSYVPSLPRCCPQHLPTSGSLSLQIGLIGIVSLYPRKDAPAGHILTPHQVPAWLSVSLGLLLEAQGWGVVL